MVLVCLRFSLMVQIVVFVALLAATTKYVLAANVSATIRLHYLLYRPIIIIAVLVAKHAILMLTNNVWLGCVFARMDLPSASYPQAPPIVVRAVRNV